jgi:hypothetical protein
VQPISSPRPSSPLHSRRNAGHAIGAGCQTSLHKLEFSFLNSNLIAPASQPSIFSYDTLPMMEEHMFGESIQGAMTETLLFLAIVGLTMVSTIDLYMQPIKQEKNTDQKH